MAATLPRLTSVGGRECDRDALEWRADRALRPSTRPRSRAPRLQVEAERFPLLVANADLDPKNRRATVADVRRLEAALEQARNQALDLRDRLPGDVGHDQRSVAAGSGPLERGQDGGDGGDLGRMVGERRGDCEAASTRPPGVWSTTSIGRSDGVSRPKVKRAALAHDTKLATWYAASQRAVLMYSPWRGVWTCG